MERNDFADDERPLLELDARRRASFGRIGHVEHRRYLVAEEPDGTIILTPAVVMTEAEARLRRNPELVERIVANVADPSRTAPREHSD